MLTQSSDRNAKPGQAAAAARREERLAQALRDNLKRRKEQARCRVAPAPQTGLDGPAETTLVPPERR